MTADYGSFGSVNGGFNLAYGGPEVGKFHFRERIEQRPIPRPARIHRDARQGQRRECVRSRGLSALDRGLHSLQFGLHALLVPDAQFVRRPECHAMVRRGGRQRRPRSKRQRRWPHRSALADSNIQHRADLDAADQFVHGLYSRRFRAARPIQLLPKRQSLSRISALESSAGDAWLRIGR